MKILRTISTLIFAIACHWVFAQSDTTLQFTEPERLRSTVNSYAEESYPLISSDGNTLYFIRTFHQKNTGNPQRQDIWYSEKDTSGKWTQATNELGPLNDGDNNAVVGLSRDGYTLYLLNEYTPGPGSRPGVSKSKRTKDGWSPPEAVDFPDIALEDLYYSLYKPVDENYFMLTMNIKSGNGRNDIYVVTRNDFGEWLEPINLGNVVNTPSDEISPYYDPDTKRLYFASRGHKGLGNYDLFYSERTDTTNWTSWSEPINPGSPVNSKSFDAYLSMTGDHEVYFCSTRDDTISNIFRCKLMDLDKMEPEEEELDSLVTDEDVRNREPELVIETKDTTGTAKTSLKQLSREELLDEETRVRFIYFAFDKAKIFPKYTEVLDDVIAILDENPDVKVKFNGHTDSIGTIEYNQGLSERRAKAARDYVVANGVDTRRVETEGFSELEPYATNETPEGRGKNRRVEIDFQLSR